MKHNRNNRKKRKGISLFISHLSSQLGFTLIELLVVIAMMAVLTSLGVASYSSYNNAQVIQTAGSDVVNMLNTAKSQAISQVKPADCKDNPLSGYQVTIDSVQQQYTLSAVCGTDAIDTFPSIDPSISPSISPVVNPSVDPSANTDKPHTVTITTQPLPAQVNFDTNSSSQIFFAISTGTITSPQTVIITGYGKTKTITVSPTGNISVN
ncbi:MAG: pilus assembly FimT family protein [Candidatus Levyibacteriota bacterium]